MPVKKDPEYKKYLSYLKDLIYIVGILALGFGWINAKAKSEAILETTVKQNTEVIKKLEIFMGDQAMLNGKILQFMEMTADNS